MDRNAIYEKHNPNARGHKVESKYVITYDIGEGN
jgi:hypothetical protein